jgi:hypothetical protein
MKAYRVYALDDERLVVRARLIEAKGDDEALSAAAAFGWPRWQLWRGSRLIRDSASPHADVRPLSGDRDLVVD